MPGFTPIWNYEVLSGRTGSGGGSSTVYAWNTVQHVPTLPYAAGSVTITLPQTPADADAVQVDYSGVVLQQGTQYSISGAVVTILFADPYTDYDTTPYFQVRYPYTV